MSISCSVVSYHNPPEQIAQVLRSIVATPGIVACLVDNSRDDSLSVVAQQFGIRYLHRPDNPGFGAAHNIAIADALASGSTYHLVLNPDISFSADVIPALHAYMESHHDIGLIMPDIRYPDGSRQHLCKLLPHPVDLLVRRFMPPLYRLSGRLDTYEMRRADYDGIMDVPALSGCFMFLRSSILEKTGGFDDRFFMYMEDVDLSRRIGQLSRTVFFPFVSIVHAYEKGSYKNRKLLTYHIRSAIRYFNKWGWFFDAQRSAVNRKALQCQMQSQTPAAEAASLSNRK